MGSKVILSAAFTALATLGVAQSVTVNSAGGADFASISAALASVQGNPAGPDVITVQNAGPYFEAGQLLISGDISDNDLTLQASAGIRPLVISDFNGDGALGILKNGNTTVTDLILIPGLGDPATRPQAAVLIDDEAGDTGFNVVLQNLLITSNDGANQPFCTLDGLTSPTVVPGTTVTFRDEGLLGNSQTVAPAPTNIHKINLQDFIVCGLFGDQGSDGIRTFTDGGVGTEVVVGPGCVVSYCTAAGASNGALQPGGNEGSPAIFRVQGSTARPVKLINNTLNGISITGTNLVGSTKSFASLIVANNTRAGFTTSDSNESYSFANVTFANNGAEPLNETSAFDTTATASNTIFAGDGTDGTDNVIDVSSSAAGTLTLSDSAVVLNGPFKLDTANFDFDGLDDNTPVSNVTSTTVTSADPQFASLDPTNPNFAAVTNPSYGTAGPGGAPLTGGGTFMPAASVKEWMLF